MREIKFRAKEKKDNEWVYGSLIRSDEYYGDKRENPSYYICPFNTTFEHSNCYKDSEEIDIETLGQFTGLKDKNGTKIFEGDIVEFDEKEWGYKYFEEIKWDYELLDLRKNDYKQWCVVVGNVYDNPELLNK